MTERDPLLRRLERDAVLACAAMAGLALAVPGGGPWMAVAVAGGGLLAASSYRTIKVGVDAAAGGGSRTTASLVKYFTRYAILVAAAYVMLVRLRLHAMGVLAGASSVVVAATVAAARSRRPMSRSGHPRS